MHVPHTRGVRAQVCGTYAQCCCAATCGGPHGGLQELCRYPRSVLQQIQPACSDLLRQGPHANLTLHKDSARTARNEHGRTAQPTSTSVREAPRRDDAPSRSASSCPYRHTLSCCASALRLTDIEVRAATADSKICSSAGWATTSCRPWG